MADGNPAKSLLQSESLTQYILDTSTYPREHEQLKELREATRKKYGHYSIQTVAADEAQFISMLLKVMNAKRTMEIGVFTGYSLLATVLALPFDGQVTAIDIDREAFEFGLQFIQKVGMEYKINFIESDAISALDAMLQIKEEERGEGFDFVFVDAAKSEYRQLHERALKLVRVGGIVAYDNTLWFGTVAWDEPQTASMPDFVQADRKPIIDFNTFLSSDRRIELSQLSIGDGLTLCRRLL